MIQVLVLHVGPTLHLLHHHLGTHHLATPTTATPRLDRIVSNAGRSDRREQIIRHRKPSLLTEHSERYDILLKALPNHGKAPALIFNISKYSRVIFKPCGRIPSRCLNAFLSELFVCPKSQISCQPGCLIPPVNHTSHNATPRTTTTLGGCAWLALELFIGTVTSAFYSHGIG